MYHRTYYHTYYTVKYITLWRSTVVFEKSLFSIRLCLIKKHYFVVNVKHILYNVLLSVHRYTWFLNLLDHNALLWVSKKTLFITIARVVPFIVS